MYLLQVKIQFIFFKYLIFLLTPHLRTIYLNIRSQHVHSNRSVSWDFTINETEIRFVPTLFTIVEIVRSAYVCVNAKRCVICDSKTATDREYRIDQVKIFIRELLAPKEWRDSVVGETRDTVDAFYTIHGHKTIVLRQTFSLKE